ncbi:MAG: hypothetical protein M3Q69_03485 [Acidobacteriota bacterium]|nr:hypothetical protein [Acidobacteriota bacterium]
MKETFLLQERQDRFFAFAGRERLQVDAALYAHGRPAHARCRTMERKISGSAHQWPKIGFVIVMTRQ